MQVTSIATRPYSLACKPATTEPTTMMRRRRGLPSFCHGVASTSTIQQLPGKHLVTGSGTAADTAASSSFLTVPPSVVGLCVAETEVSGGTGGEPVVTLEQMILQLDLEEEAARKARRVEEAAEEEGWCPRRMSCVDGGVLRSARDALSQYPRFSLDGRDAMYRASFSRPGGYEMDLERTLRMPATVAGESVVWCKPGVVAKLMGLEAVPVPVKGGGLRRRKQACGGHAAAAATCGGIRKHSRLRRAVQEEMVALNKEKLFMALHGYDVVGAGAARHAGARRSDVGPGVSGMGDDDGDGWEFRLRR